MKRTLVQEEVRKKRFLEAYEGWNQGRVAFRMIITLHHDWSNEQFRVLLIP
jgi:hypothetical protein